MRTDKSRADLALELQHAQARIAELEFASSQEDDRFKRIFRSIRRQ